MRLHGNIVCILWDVLEADLLGLVLGSKIQSDRLWNFCFGLLGSIILSLVMEYAFYFNARREELFDYYQHVSDVINIIDKYKILPIDANDYEKRKLLNYNAKLFDNEFWRILRELEHLASNIYFILDFQNKKRLFITSFCDLFSNMSQGVSELCYHTSQVSDLSYIPNIVIKKWENILFDIHMDNNIQIAYSRCSLQAIDMEMLKQLANGNFRNCKNLKFNDMRLPDGKLAFKSSGPYHVKIKINESNTMLDDTGTMNDKTKTKKSDKILPRNIPLKIYLQPTLSIVKYKKKGKLRGCLEHSRQCQAGQTQGLGYGGSQGRRSGPSHRALDHRTGHHTYPEKGRYAYGRVHR